MFLLDKFTTSGERFKNNEDGNMAMTFAFTMTTLVILLGSAMDYSTLSKAHNTSQRLAESTALNAAIFIKNNGRVPKNNTEGYMDGQTYTAAELGHTYKGMIEGGSENVLATVVYDDHAKEARVTVTGATIPSFMQVTGKTRLPFTAEAVVSYLEIDEKFPASIVMVLDNSGSMAWDELLAESDGSSPAGARSRINGLQAASKNFKRRLSSRLNDQTGGYRTMRMGQIPYSSNVLTAAQQNMKWGYIPDGKIDLMTPQGSTNSNPPMALAKSWMEGEESIHNSEADRVGKSREEPLKFVIFMTDGQNTSGSYEVIPGDTGYWYKYFTGYGWYYRRDARAGWTEGTLQLDTDRVTIQSCQQMKDDGVEIFTIGYALDVGAYNANNPTDDKATEYVNEGMRSTAYSMLQACASKPEYFIVANAKGKLDAAFDTIQNAIVEELIRVKS